MCGRVGRSGGECGGGSGETLLNVKIPMYGKFFLFVGEERGGVELVQMDWFGPGALLECLARPSLLGRTIGAGRAVIKGQPRYYPHWTERAGVIMRRASPKYSKVRGG